MAEGWGVAGNGIIFEVCDWFAGDEEVGDLKPHGLYLDSAHVCVKPTD